LNRHKTYSGEILELGPNQIAVPGTNTQGRHGKGFALKCKEKWGAIYGQPSGLQGRCYGIITKDLTKKSHPSRTPEEIKKEIEGLYKFATENSNLEFLIPYNCKGSNLNAYSSEDMASFFAAFEIPLNIVFEEEFYELIKRKKMKKAAQVVLLNEQGLVLAVSRKDNHNDFGLPGGKVDPEDADEMAAAIREVKEETGLDIYDLELVFAMHRNGYMGYTYIAKYKKEDIKHNEPHVVKWVPFEVIMNGSFGKFNRLVAESLTNIGIKFCSNINIEQLSDAVKDYVNDYFKDSDIRFSFLRKENYSYVREGYVVYLTSDEPEYLDEGLDVPDSFDEALKKIGQKFGVFVHLSSDYASK